MWALSWIMFVARSSAKVCVNAVIVPVLAMRNTEHGAGSGAGAG
jgi:hypothetical protein